MNPTPDQPKTIYNSDMPDFQKTLKNAEDKSSNLFLQHECIKKAKQKFFIFGMDENVHKAMPQWQYALRWKFHEAEIL